MRLTEEEFARLTGQSIPPKKKNKHRNIKVYVLENGMTFENREEAKTVGKIEAVFDSKKEYSRWLDLNYLQKAKQITDLQRQVSLLITPQGEYQGQIIREISYKADFVYKINGITYIEDVKPFDKNSNKYRTTKDFNIKWKLLKQKYPDFKFVLY